MAPPTCICCFEEKTRLFGLNSKKSTVLDVCNNLKILINRDFNTRLLDESFVCEKCARILSQLILIRRNVINKIENSEIDNESVYKKRLAETPEQQQRKKQRKTVAEQLERSVEKLKKDVQEPGTIKQSSCTRKVLFDHGYSEPSVEGDDPIPLDASLEDLLLNKHTNRDRRELLEVLDAQLSKLTNKHDGVLYNRSSKQLSEQNMFRSVILELQEGCPLLLEVLSCSLGKTPTLSSKIATIWTMYGMIMHCRNARASAVQRLYTSLAIRYHADNKLLQYLNRVHITLSESSKSNLIREFGHDMDRKLVQGLTDGKMGKLNGDNLDLHVSTNDIRMANRDREYHFFASSFILDRVPYTNEQFNISESTPEYENFIPNNSEIKRYKDSLKILLGRIMMEHIPGFGWMKNIVPCHIVHSHTEEMSRKSSIHSLPLSLNNECSYEGCLKIMEEYTEMINNLFSKAGRASELDGLKVPVGGDQLTRVRLQGAKQLRAGAHTIQERFEQLYPVVVELFHTLQDFVEKLCKKFLNLQSGRDKCTLGHLKIVLNRSDVNGNVKSRFQGHEDFVLTVGEAYFLDYILKKFQMQSCEDQPVHENIPGNIKNVHVQTKEEVFHEMLDDIVSELYIPFTTQRKVTVLVSVGDNAHTELDVDIKSSAIIPLFLHGRNIMINIPLSKLKKGHLLKINETPVHVIEKPSDEADELHNYVKNFLQWYFIMIQLKDAIQEGDLERTNIILKSMIPFFFSHSALSKYFVECIDYILKTEIILPPNLSLRVQAGSFVNLHGGIGKNKAADMAKENEIKVMKDLIRGLGSNKTESSILSVTKASPVIKAICENVKGMLQLKKVKTTHKHRTREDDIAYLLQELKSNSPWIIRPGRCLMKFREIADTPFSFDFSTFLHTIDSTIERLMRDLPEGDVNIESDEDN